MTVQDDMRDSQDELIQFKAYLRQIFIELNPVLAKTCTGDFPSYIPVPKKDGELGELYSGIQLMVELMREQFTKLKQLNHSLEKAITEQTTELHREHILLRQAEHLAYIGSWEFDLSSLRLTWSEGLYLIYGVTRESFRPDADNVMQFIHPDDREYLKYITKKYYQAPGPIDYYYRIIRPDGSVRIIHGRDEAIKDKNGNLLRSIGTVQDVTKKKRAEATLRRQKQLYQALLQVQSEMGEGFSICRGEKFIYMNSALCRIYGYDRKELLAMPSFIDLVVPEERDRFRNHVKEIMCGKNKNDKGEVIINHKDGHRVHIAYSIRLVDTESGPNFFSIIRDITAEKKAQEELRRLAIIVETTADAVTAFTPEGVFTSWNRSAEKIYGYTAREMVGRSTVFDLAPKGSKANLKRALRRVMQGEKIQDYRTRGKCKNGKIIDLSITLTPLIGIKGNVNEISGISRDVTEQQRIQEMIREQEELYRTLFESLSEGLVITGTNDTILFVNSQMEMLTEYGVSEMIGKRAYHLLVPEGDHEKMRDRLASRLAGNSESYELRIMKKDKTYFWAQVNAAPYRNAKGQIMGTVAAITDITAKKHERELENLALASTKSYNSVVITDCKGCIEWVNEGFTALTGYSLEDIKGTFGEVLRKGDPEALRKYTSYLTAVRNTKKPISFENRNFKKDGDEFWAVTTLSPVTDTRGNVKIIAIDSDISEQKKLEDDLRITNKIAEHSLRKGHKALEELRLAKKKIEHSVRVKEKFLANISHEIRTPMNGIIGLTEVMLRTEISEQQKKYLEAIKSSGDTLMVVINDILDISKIEAGKMTFEEMPLLIADICQNVLRLFTPKAREKNITLKKRIPASLPFLLLGDTVRLNQILGNLVSNAIKFTDKGEVLLAVRLVGEDEEAAWIEFSVNDTGRGIPADKIDSLFLDFTQVHATRVRDYGGTGLGLAITKRLVELQGGEIKVESEIDRGSTFTCRMKFKKCTDEKKFAETGKGKEEIINTKLNGLKILLVEDNPVNMILAEQILTDWKCFVDKASDGKDAYEKTRANDYNIILMDIKMPVMDGYEATRCIRHLPPPKCNIPILALTAHAATWEAEKCRKIGMNAYIAKPFNINELREHIQRLTSGKNITITTATMETKLDLTYLKSIAKGNTGFEFKMLNTFVEQTKDEMEKIKLSLDDENWDEVYSSVHKIKPSFHFIGAAKSEKLIQEIEDQIKEKRNMEKMPDLIHSFINSCGRDIEAVKAEIEHYRKNGQKT